MKRIHTCLITVLLGTLPWLSACGSGNNKPASDETAAEASEGSSEETGLVASRATEVREEVLKKMREDDLSLDSDDKDVPEAEITPQGDLVIDGKKVAIDDGQRELLLQYRDQVSKVAAAGAEVGLQAADIAGDAVGEALKSIFTGGTDDLEQRIEARVEKKIEGPVRKLCAQLPPLLETQQALVASLPEFEPYADMDEGDIDDCLDEAKADL